MTLGFTLIHAHNIHNRKDHFSLDSNGTLIALVKEKKSGTTKDQLICKAKYRINHLYAVKVKGNIICYIDTSLSTSIAEGDIININNPIYPINENRNPHSFDYKSYLSHKGIYHSTHLSEGNYTIFGKSKVNWPFALINNIRSHIEDSINKNISQPDNKAILKAMLLGDKTELDDDTKESFSETGAIHILAVSGLHVGIISGILIWLLSILPFYLSHGIRYMIILTGIWIYVLITGMGAPTIRAAAMFSLYLIAPIIYRKSNAYNSLGIAALIILLFDPHQLFTISFQFSFLALTSIITYYTPIEKLLISPYPLVRYIWKLVALSISAQILLFPLIIYYFNQFPTYFWVSGILAIPAATIIVGAGLLLSFFAIFAVFNSLKDCVSQFVEFFLDKFLLSMDFIRSLPFHIMDNLWITDLELGLIYAIIILLTLGFKGGAKQLIFAAAITGLFVTGYRHFNIRKEKSKSELIVYDMYNKVFIEKYNGQCYQTVYSKNISVKLEERNFKKLRLSKYSTTSCDIPLIPEWGHYTIMDNQLALINPNEKITDYKFKKDISLLILSEYREDVIPRLIEENSINQIVITNLGYRDTKELEKICVQQEVPLFNTKESGPFIKQFR